MIQVTFLGTSAATPTLHRGLPAIAIRRDGEIILLDCGEGAQLQLKRSDMRISRISKIFISHLHGDHVNGLMGLLMSMELDDRQQPLTIIGPRGVQAYFTGIKRIIRARFTFDIDFITLESGFAIDGKEYTISTLPLRHRMPCFGFCMTEHPRPGRFNVEKALELGIKPGPLYGRLQAGESVQLESGRIVEPKEVLGPTREGRKICYIADTRTFPAEVEFCRNADLLIHESTYTTNDLDKAQQRDHTTAAQAALIARQAAVKQLVLTHISPRYTDYQDILLDAKRHFENVLVAKDMMTIEIPRKE